MLEEERHVLSEEYSSNVSHQDGDLPYRMQITYRDGGPSYFVNDYFPHFHYQASAALADQDYNLLVEYWGDEKAGLEDLETDSDTVEKLMKRGAVDNISELGLD